MSPERVSMRCARLGSNSDTTAGSDTGDRAPAPAPDLLLAIAHVQKNVHSADKTIGISCVSTLSEHCRMRISLEASHVFGDKIAGDSGSARAVPATRDGSDRRLGCPLVPQATELVGLRIYLAAAIRGLAMAPAMFPEVADDDLQEHLLRFAEATLMRRRRRTRETRVEPSP
jgi:hypothetical protein